MNVHWRKGGGSGEREEIFSSNLLLLEYEHIFYACYNYHQEREREEEYIYAVFLVQFSFVGSHDDDDVQNSSSSSFFSSSSLRISFST